MHDLLILAHVSTPALIRGFLPAALELGLSPILFTDHPDEHHRDLAAFGLEPTVKEIIACDVFNPLAVLEAAGNHARRAAAVFSNSDHLQTSAAVLADYLGLPGKNWKTTYRVKDKLEMRAFADAQGLSPVRYATVGGPHDLLASDMPFPCVVKPRQGVASRDVRLVHDRAELEAYCRSIWQRQPSQALLLEEYLEGELHTLETLGDGRRIQVLGGFRVELSPPPHFIELEAHWEQASHTEAQAAVLAQLQAFGVGFGASHTEYVMTKAGPRLVEINYRLIGDQRDMLLQEALGIPIFENILRLHLGEPLPTTIQRGQSAATIRYFPAHAAGELTAAPQGFKHRDDQVRLDYQPLRSPGDYIELTHSNKDYLGVLSVSGPHPQTLKAAMERAASDLRWEIRP